MARAKKVAKVGVKKEKGYLYVTAPNIFVAENKAKELYNIQMQI